MAKQPDNMIVVIALAVLLPRGYKKKGPSFNKTQADLNGIINLQRSQYSNKYYVNIALYDPKSSPVEWPPEHKCDARMRIEDISSINADMIDMSLDLDCDMSPIEREAVLNKIILEAANFIERAATYDDFKRLYINGAFYGGLVSRHLKDISH